MLLPEKKGQPTKHKEAGGDGDKSIPDVIWEGLFKRGTSCKHGVFKCPSDVLYDTTEGHNQSESLDKIEAALGRLLGLRKDLSGDQAHDWGFFLY